MKIFKLKQLKIVRIKTLKNTFIGSLFYSLSDFLQLYYIIVYIIKSCPNYSMCGGKGSTRPPRNDGRDYLSHSTLEWCPEKNKYWISEEMAEKTAQ